MATAVVGLCCVPLDMVAVFGETTGELALKQLKHKMMQDRDGRRILRCVHHYRCHWYMYHVCACRVWDWIEVGEGEGQPNINCREGRVYVQVSKIHNAQEIQD